MKEINQIVAVGSVDGLLTAAAVLAAIKSEGKDPATVGLTFCQAFTVHKVDVFTFEPNSNVLFVDLAVNNRDKNMTKDFVKSLTEAGHKIWGILDEHSAEDWIECFEECNLDFDELHFKPCSQEPGSPYNIVYNNELVQSSGALFSTTGEYPENIKNICSAAAEADKGVFTSHFASLVNQAVKSKIMDDSRRVYLARHFAEHSDPDDTISDWIKEYQEILKNNEEAIATAVAVNDNFIIIDTGNKPVDMTSLMMSCYKRAKVVGVWGEFFSPKDKCKKRMFSLGTNDKDMNLVEYLQGSGVPCGGFAQKANVDAEHAERAIDAIVKIL